jgi:hypothetical protein
MGVVGWSLSHTDAVRAGVVGWGLLVVVGAGVTFPRDRGGISYKE